MTSTRTWPRWLVLLGALLCASGAAGAATTATLSSDTLSLGQTTTLTLSTDESVSGQVDLSPLQADFNVLSQSSGSNTMIVNGQRSSTFTLTLEIEPKRAGVLVVPPLTLGGSASAPVVVTVGAAAPAGPGTDLYMETSIGSERPYVQQAVPYTVRLYYTLPRLQGDVEVPPPANASLKQIGSDQNYQQDVGGQRYNVFQRNYLLTPERSGVLELPGARFRGRASNPGVDPFFDRGRSVATSAPGRTLDVRPQPDGAAQPWLPAHALQLVRGDLSGARPVAGEPLMVELTLNAQGLTQSQLPELTLPEVPGAQVFPEPPQLTEDLSQTLPRAAVKRRFALVPLAAGSLTLPAVRIGWWNTAEDRAAVAELPALTLQVAPGAAIAGAVADSPAAVPAGGGTANRGVTSETGASSPWPWMVSTAVLALALLGSLTWGWRFRAPRTRTASRMPAVDADRAGASGTAELRAALAGGDLGRIALALANTRPNSAAMLSDRAQQEAWEALQQQRWGTAASANIPALQTRLREVFARGACWQVAATADARTLPDQLAPLYPQRHQARPPHTA